MIRVMEKHAFYTQLLAGQAATWSIAEGVCFASCREHHAWGVALNVERGVLTSEQLKQTFARRFSDAKRYHGYLLSLNSQSKLTIWYALPRAIQEYLILDKIRDMQLFLAGLEHLSL